MFVFNHSEFSLVQGTFKGSYKEEYHQKDSNDRNEILLSVPLWISVLLTDENKRRVSFRKDI